MVIVLDTGVLGLLTSSRVEARRLISDYLKMHPQATVILPEICDYELRREFVLNGRSKEIERLEQLGRRYNYMAIRTEHMREACAVWADCRKNAFPFTSDESLDADCILIAQALDHERGEAVVLTSNAKHIGRYLTPVQFPR